MPGESSEANEHLSAGLARSADLTSDCSNVRPAGLGSHERHPNAHVSLLAREASGQASSAVRPAEALPRRLQACMQELLTVNERYHELLRITESQRVELESAREELAQLRPACAAAQSKIDEHNKSANQAHETAAVLQASNDLQAAQLAASKAECSDLHKVLRSYAERLLRCEAELQATKQRNVEAEALLATHWEEGYEEGQKQQQTEVRARLRRANEQAKQKVEEAFEKGKQANAQATSSRLLREQAERRVLLRRAEEARLQQRNLRHALAEERQARGAASERSSKLEQRLRSVRHHKAALADELEATREAHSTDLRHFEQMENALGVACAEYSSLAARHARAVSPPPSKVSSTSDGAFGTSPPSAARSKPPQPAALHAQSST